MNFRLFSLTALLCAAAINSTAAIGFAHEEHPSPTGQTHPHGGMTGADDHDHGAMEIPAGQPVPTVNLIVHPDSRRGWNLEIQTTNFTFAPERVNQTSISTRANASKLGWSN